MLDSISPLNGFSANINDVEISEVTQLSMVSLAVPGGNADTFGKAVQKHLKCEIPQPDKLTRSKPAGSLLVWTAADQFFHIFETAEPDPEKSLKAKFGNAAYITDQSDGWVMLRVAGVRKTEVMERICQLDLHPEKFPVDSASRTMMDHLGVLILHDTDGSFLLLSGRSSAQHLLHAVETSAKNI